MKNMNKKAEGAGKIIGGICIAIIILIIIFRLVLHISLFGTIILFIKSPSLGISVLRSTIGI